MAEVQFNVPGRVALVTGASNGIGREIALGLARIGIDVGVVGRDPERLASVAAEIEKIGRRAYGTVADVGRASDVQGFVAGVTEHLGPIDILVNSAGIYPRTSVPDMSQEEWDRVFATNVKSVFLVSQAVLPGMLARRYGRIVSITSGVATTGSDRGAHYAASKGGINGFTLSLAKETAGKGVNVNAVAPGTTETLMLQRGRSPEYIAALRKTMPEGRISQPEDVVGLVLFLVSNGAKYITGKIITFR
jgi:3-oxoacyl-[acyl-carrier protein] reductase